MSARCPDCGSSAVQKVAPEMLAPMAPEIAEAWHCGNCEWRGHKPAEAELVAQEDEDAAHDDAFIRNLVAHATGGAIYYQPGMTLNGLCVEISRHHNRVYQAGEEKALAQRAPSREVEALEKARITLGYVETEDMKGDNLAVTLCTAFNSPDCEDDDESGWPACTVAAHDAALDAIHAHYMEALATPDAEAVELLRRAKWLLPEKQSRLRDEIDAYLSRVAKGGA